jgi:hypothetical protein
LGDGIWVGNPVGCLQNVVGVALASPSRFWGPTEAGEKSERDEKKKFLMGIAGVTRLVTPASAADLAARPYAKAPALIAAVYDWSGFYIGANGGWGFEQELLDQHHDIIVPVRANQRRLS